MLMMIPFLPIAIAIGGIALVALLGRGGVPGQWGPAEQRRVDAALATCLNRLRSQGWPTASVSDPNDPERELSSVEGLQLCVAQELYPEQRWPPSADETGTRAIAWEKLGEAAELAMLEAGLL